MATAWSTAGTRAGFWVHFTAMSTSLMFSVLWGVPFLVESQGFTRSGASTVLLASVALAIVAGPLIGIVISRRPAARIPLAIGSCLISVVGWYFVLAVFSGPIPRPLLIALVLITAVGSPVSGIGFSVARDYNGPSIVGTATGVVNVAGFTAAIASCLIVGWVLDAAGGPDRPGYRLAFAAAVTVQAFGLIQTVRWWRRARSALLKLIADGERTPMLIVRHRWDLT